MDVAVIGAGGEVGREVCAQLIDTRVLGSTDRLQLVTHRGGPSELGVYGLLVDLADAFSERAPVLEVVFDPHEVKADVIVFVAGVSIPHDPNRAIPRQKIGRTNLPVFTQWAEFLAEVGTGHELVLVQSNPVELAVDVLGEALGRHRVIGAAALSDSMRFRRELATVAGLGRQDISAFVVGQHGPNVLPVWSRVQIRGWSQAKVDEFCEQQRGGRSLDELPKEITVAFDRMVQLVREHDIASVVPFLESLPPDVQMAVKPFFVHYTGRTTAVLTAHAVVEMLRTVSLANSALIPAQVGLDNQWPGFIAPVAVPVILQLNHWTVAPTQLLRSDELTRLQEIHDLIAAEHLAITGKP